MTAPYISGVTNTPYVDPFPGATRASSIYEIFEISPIDFEFAECEVPRGYFGVEAEGIAIEFRNIQRKPHPGKKAAQWAPATRDPGAAG